ncbi:MAG: 30S ribosomal protein S3 [Anaerolineae bacterium]|nr:30S ribosomal protein S3 [Anaerolineae bacterium]
MGRKVHPIGFRLNIIKPWEGRWFAEGNEYRDQLHQDIAIRDIFLSKARKTTSTSGRGGADADVMKRVQENTAKAGISLVEVERFPGKVKVSVNTAKPGVLIGRKGENVKVIRQELEALVGKKVDLEIKEIKNPDMDALLVAQNIAGQIQRRVGYRRAMKRAIQQALRQGALGVKVIVSGRLSGAEMARTVVLREGQVPLQTLRADIDFARAEALTTYGQIGIKVWIYRGEVLPHAEEKVEPTEGVYVSE